MILWTCTANGGASVFIRRSQHAATEDESQHVVKLRPGVESDPFVPIIAIYAKVGFVKGLLS